MKSLFQLRTDNLHAAIREARHLLERVNELEQILGIPPTAEGVLSLPQLRKRRDNLHAIAAQRIDPNDDGVQRLPIILGE